MLVRAELRGFLYSWIVLAGLICFAFSGIAQTPVKLVFQDRGQEKPVSGLKVELRNGNNVVQRVSDSLGVILFEANSESSLQVVITDTLFKATGMEFFAPFKSSYTIQIQSGKVDYEVDPVEILGVPGELSFGFEGAATAISPRQITLVQPIGTQEMLERVPGVTGFSDDGIGNSRINVSIRGLPPRRSNKILFLEDGIPIAPAVYTYSNMYYNPPAERIESIEVLKGAAGIAFGPQTMGGVINYITSRPRKEFGGVAKLTYGLNSFRSIYSEIGGFGNKSIHPEFQLLYKGGDGFRDNNGFNQFNGTFKLNVLPDSKKHSLYSKVNFNKEVSNATYTGLTEYSFATNPNFNPKEHDQFTVDRIAGDLIHKWTIKPGKTLTSKAYFSHFVRHWWREFDAFAIAEEYESGVFQPVDYLTNGNLIRVGDGQNSFGILRDFVTGGLSSKYDWLQLIGEELTGRLTVSAGSHYEVFNNRILFGEQPDSRNGTFFSLNEASGDTAFYGTDQTFRALAFKGFVSESFYWKNLKFVPGVRVEHFTIYALDHLYNPVEASNTVTVVLPGAGLTYDYRSWQFFGGVHKGFTPPSRSSLLIIDPSTIPNYQQQLEAETSWNYEAGLRIKKDWLEWESSVFYLDIRNMLDLSRGTQLNQLGKVISMGVENYVRFKPSCFIEYFPDVVVNYTLLQTEIRDGVIDQSVLEIGPADISGNELPYAPRHSATIGLEKTFAKTLDVFVSASIRSQAFSDVENLEFTFNRGDTGPIPGYWLLNAGVHYVYKSKFDFSISGKNLLDKVYIGSRLHSNPLRRQADVSSGILPGARRQINVSVGCYF